MIFIKLTEEEKNNIPTHEGHFIVRPRAGNGGFFYTSPLILNDPMIPQSVRDYLSDKETVDVSPTSIFPDDE